MREAMGGSLLMYMVLPIIVLFICFIAFIMNYASAYRAANYVITQIENCQGQMNNCGSSKNKMTDIKTTIQTKYKYFDDFTVCYIVNGKDNYVYRVGLPVSFDVPLFGNVSPVSVMAETKTIVKVPQTSVGQFSKCK